MKPPIPSELLVHIGDMTVSFALLEFQMQLIFITLVNESARIGHILACSLSFRSLRATIISLYRERHGTEAGYLQLRALMGKAARIEEERNQITHSIWAADKTTGSITRTKMTAQEKHGFRTHFKEYDAASLSDLANRIQVLAEDMLNFYILLPPNSDPN